MSLILYAVIILIVLVIIFVINKFDKDKTAQRALKDIK